MLGVLVALIPKQVGGDRPIGLLQGTARLWYRARRPLLKAWESSAASGAHFSASSGRSCLDSVWRRAFRAEAGQASSENVLTIFTDLRKCYEHVKHSDLVVEAKAAMFPMTVLR